jgi:hypothetical protein
MAFTLFHLYHTPMVEVDSVYSKSLQGGLTEVTAIVRNNRVIPTHTLQDLRNKITRPDWVSLKGGDVVSGSVLQNRFTGLAQEQKRHPEQLEVENVPGMNAVYVRWIVRGSGPFTVTIDSEKGGMHSMKSK